MTPAILLLRGAPGAGKSTVARLLHCSVVAVVEVDDLRGELCRCAAGRLTRGDRHLVALTMAASMALALLAAGQAVVVVDTFSAEGVAAFERAICDRARIVAVALLVGAEEHTHRLRTRPEVPGVFRDLETARAMDEALALEALRIVDTTGATPDRVAQGVREHWREFNHALASARRPRFGGTSAG